MIGVCINQNLPRSLSTIFKSAGIPAHHVRDVGLAGSGDKIIWEMAIEKELAIVTKDIDYLDLALTRNEGQVILVTVGNLKLNNLKQHMMENMTRIVQFLGTDERILSI